MVYVRLFARFAAGGVPLGYGGFPVAPRLFPRSPFVVYSISFCFFPIANELLLPIFGLQSYTFFVTPPGTMSDGFSCCAYRGAPSRCRRADCVFGFWRQQKGTCLIKCHIRFMDMPALSYFKGKPYRILYSLSDKDATPLFYGVSVPGCRGPTGGPAHGCGVLARFLATLSYDVGKYL